MYVHITNFADMLNPNGCSAKGTFFVSHKYTNYSAVQEFHRKGHEIGVFSITRKQEPKYWSKGKKKWSSSNPILCKYALDVLGGQPIKIAQVASTSELLENQQNKFLFFKIIPSHFCRASEASKIDCFKN